MTISSSPGMTAKENDKMTKPQLVRSAIRTGHVFFDREHPAISLLESHGCDMPPTTCTLGNAAWGLVAIPTDMVCTRPRVECDNSIHSCHISSPEHRQAGLTLLFALIYGHAFSPKARYTPGSTPLNAGTYGPNSPDPTTSDALIDAGAVGRDGDL